VPDQAAAQVLRSEALLATRLGRRGFVEALKHPEQLTAEQKGVLLFLSLAGLAVLVLLLNSIIALALPELAPGYRALLGDALLQLGTLLGLPVAVEPAILVSTAAVGAVPTFLAFFVAKMYGAWLMYLVGDALHGAVARRGGRWTQRLVDWLRRNADRYGLLVLVLDNALPLAPDQVMYVLAVSGMSFRRWMLGIAAGSAVRFGILIGGALLVGPERAAGWFLHPFG
jgi:membrane protein YqaA with SNARE-associated domain